jgi:hypothetical protein
MMAMPWVPGRSQKLTDDQIWATVCADPSRSWKRAAAHLRHHAHGMRLTTIGPELGVGTD